eukprot:gene22657-biopygen20760
MRAGARRAAGDDANAALLCRYATVQSAPPPWETGRRPQKGMEENAVPQAPPERRGNVHSPTSPCSRPQRTLGVAQGATDAFVKGYFEENMLGICYVYGSRTWNTKLQHQIAKLCDSPFWPKVCTWETFGGIATLWDSGRKHGVPR